MPDAFDSDIARIFGQLRFSPGGALRTCPEEHHITISGEKTADASGNISATAILTPSSDKKLSVHVMYIHTDGSSGVVNLDYVSSAIKVARLYASNERQSIPHPTHVEGAVDEVLTLSTASIGNGSKVFYSIQYVEED
jgi:hypothetical protein